MKLTRILTIAALLWVATNAQPARAQVGGLTAVHKVRCPTGYYDFAWDGKSQIRFCKTSQDAPDDDVFAIDIRGIFPSDSSENCSRLGRNWKRFAWDGPARLTYCAEWGLGEGGYIKDVTAVMGRNTCARGWSMVVYNGHSNISFCALFSR